MITLKWRAVAFVVITAIVLPVGEHYDQWMIRNYDGYPQPNFLASTWYGAILLLLIPISFGWLSMVMKHRIAKVLGLIGTVLLLFFWFVLVVNALKFVGKDPWTPATWWATELAAGQVSLVKWPHPRAIVDFSLVNGNHTPDSGFLTMATNERDPSCVVSPVVFFSSSALSFPYPPKPTLPNFSKNPTPSGFMTSPRVKRSFSRSLRFRAPKSNTVNMAGFVNSTEILESVLRTPQN